MAEVYEMLMKIGLDNKASAGLLAISNQLMAIESVVGRITAGIGGWKLAVAAVGSVLIGGAMVKGLETIAEAGGDVNHQLELMKQAGVSIHDQQIAMQAAQRNTSSVITTTYSENLKSINELRSAFGDTARAVEHLESLTKANAILNSFAGKGFGEKDEVFKFASALEGKGETIDPKEFESYINTMTKVVQATGGRVTPGMFQGAFKYGRTATQGWDEEFVGGCLGRLIQEMGTGTTGGAGGGPGNALMSAYRAVVSGKMGKNEALEFDKMGLGKADVRDGEDIGKVTGMRGADLMMKNPYRWVQEELMPSLAANGITSKEDVTAEIGKLFGNRVASDVISKMATQGSYMLGDKSQFEKDKGLNEQALGIAGFSELTKNDYPTLIKAFHQQFKSLLETLGSQVMQPDGIVIQGMRGLVGAMSSLNAFAAAHPEAMKIIITAMAGLATAFIVLGSAAVVAAAVLLVPGGAVVVAITTLAGVLGAIAIVEWEKIKNGFTWLSEGVSAIAKINVEAFVGVINGIKDALTSLVAWAQSTGEAIRHFFDLSRFLAPLPKKSSYEGEGFGSRPIVPANFTSGKGGEKQAVSLSMNLDGTTLGQAVINIITDMHEFPQMAPSPDGREAWSDVDHNYAST
jgi:hypothetical protein